MKLITLCSIQCLYAKRRRTNKIKCIITYLLLLLLLLWTRKFCKRINKIMWEIRRKLLCKILCEKTSKALILIYTYLHISYFVMKSLFALSFAYGNNIDVYDFNILWMYNIWILYSMKVLCGQLLIFRNYSPDIQFKDLFVYKNKLLLLQEYLAKVVLVQHFI